MASLLASTLRSRRRFFYIIVSLVLFNAIVYLVYHQNDAEVANRGELKLPPRQLLPPISGGVVVQSLPAHLPDTLLSADFTKVMRLLQKERSEMPKTDANHPLSKRFAFAVCCITRNEPHLKEFLVRNIMAGVEHFYVYDHNHVSEGQDVEISSVLQPFVELGMATHIRWPLANDTSGNGMPKEKFGPAQKAKFMEHCLRMYSDTADWMLRIDTDEHVLVVPPDHMLLGEQEEAERRQLEGHWQKPSAELQSIGYGYALWPLLEYAKRLPKALGSLVMPWTLMYPNHTVLASPTKALLDAFPRVCTPRHNLPKPLFRPEIVVEMHDHWVQKRKNGATEVESPWPRAKPYGQNPATAGAIIVHYYAKSVQEFLAKKEQSLKGYTRLLNNMYYKEGRPGTLCDQRFLNYPPHYHDTTHLLMRLLGHVANEGIFTNAFKGPKPLTYGEHQDFALYQFLKWAVSERMEWDEDAYFRLHPQLGTIFAQASKGSWPYVDGLHHFLRDGFWAANTTCWKVMDRVNEELVKDTLCF